MEATLCKKVTGSPHLVSERPSASCTQILVRLMTHAQHIGYSLIGGLAEVAAPGGSSQSKPFMERNFAPFHI